jgi:hypothetical protein
MQHERFKYHTRIKPKCKHKNKSREFKYPEYLSYLHEELRPPCFICGERNGIELHHVKSSSSDPKDDRMVIPLCGESCHRNGTELSAHGTPVLFRAVYPIEDQEAFSAGMYHDFMFAKGLI